MNLLTSNGGYNSYYLLVVKSEQSALHHFIVVRCRFISIVKYLPLRKSLKQEWNGYYGLGPDDACDTCMTRTVRELWCNFINSRVMKVLLTYLSKSASSQELEDFILSSHGVEDLVLYELVVAVGGLGLCGGGPPSLAVCRRLAVCDPSLWLIPFARLALKQTIQCQVSVSQLYPCFHSFIRYSLTFITTTLFLGSKTLCQMVGTTGLPLSTQIFCPDRCINNFIKGWNKNCLVHYLSLNSGTSLDIRWH